MSFSSAPSGDGVWNSARTQAVTDGRSEWPELHVEMIAKSLRSPFCVHRLGRLALAPADGKIATSSKESITKNVRLFRGQGYNGVSDKKSCTRCRTGQHPVHPAHRIATQHQCDEEACRSGWEQPEEAASEGPE